MRKIELPADEIVVLTREMALTGAGMTYRATLRGRSMLPFIRPGDTITVLPVKPDEIQWGDILVFQRGDQALVAHRLVRIKQTDDGLRYITRGDSSVYDDHPRDGSAFLGKVVTVTRGGRTRRTCGVFARGLARGWVSLYPFPQRLVRWWFRRVLRRRTQT